MPYITRKPWMVMRDEMLEHMELFLLSWFQRGLMPYHVSFYASIIPWFAYSHLYTICILYMLISLEPCRLTWSSDDLRELYNCVMAKSDCHPFALVSLQEATAYLNYEKSGGAESQWYIVGDEERKQYIPKDPEDFARTLDDSRKGLSQLIFLMCL